MSLVMNILPCGTIQTFVPRKRSSLHTTRPSLVPNGAIRTVDDIINEHGERMAEEEDINTEEKDDDGTDVVDSVIAEFLERHKGGGPKEISTGLAALDRAIIGCRTKKVMVVAARPGMGKTALAASIRRSVVDQDLVVLDFNLEMGK